MDMIRDARKSGLPAGQFQGRFLVSMPDMQSDMFAESVIYMCLHNDEGALGFILNKPASMTLAELLTHTEIADEADELIDPMAATASIGAGGPVDTNRGFVLHTADHVSDSTIEVGAGIALTSTVSILRAIAGGRGPDRSTVMLGYAGWGASQLESEMSENSWLVVDGSPDWIFDEDHTSKYGRALGAMGINAGNFMADGGRA